MYGKSLMIKPMKVWKLPKGKEHMKDTICNSGEYFGQLKKDGYWYMYEKDIKGNSFLFSRVVSKETGCLSEKSTNVPHIMQTLDRKMPNGTILIGEIYYPEGTSKDVTKIMGCLPEKAIERQNNEYGLIHYYLYDMLMYDGKLMLDIDNITRYYKLQEVYNEAQLDTDFYIELADVYYDYLSYEIDKSFENGEEGMVLKKKDGLYIPDKKPAWNMIKFKIEDEHDVVCLGYEPPTRKYEGKEIDDWQYWEGDVPVTKPYAMGWIGSIVVGAYKNGEIAEIGTISSGLTDADLEAIKIEPDAFVGKPLKAKAMMAYEGALRHPVFIGWRDDINPEDCTWDKIFE